MESTTQNHASHRRYIFGYHVAASFLALAFLVYALYEAIVNFSASALFAVFLGVALVLVGYYAREFALKAQDRVIRLEERLRLSRLLPEDLQPHIDSLSVDQLVALRFASDAELPALTRKVLSDPITDREEIKKLIKDWRPDNYRV